MRGLKLTTKEVALITSFTALYVVLYLLPVFPIIGLPGTAITASAIMAPVSGILLGPLFSVISVILSGIIILLMGRISVMSIIATGVAAFCAGLMYAGKRKICVLIYMLLLVAYGFYPYIGPLWLYPLSMWFQLIGFIILLSPLSSIAVKRLKMTITHGSSTKGKIFLYLFLICLVATLAGQIAGSLTFEIMLWPAFIGEAQAWLGIWKTIAWLYPIERVTIALLASIIGISLLGALKPVKGSDATHLNSLRHS
ncbi:MAG: hypothetical protein QXU02_03735 [Candidatus Bathyarchaeia archaeon]